MALNSQVHIYSVDSKAFYTAEEMALDKELEPLYARRTEIKKINNIDKTDEIKEEYKELNKQISRIKENLKSIISKNSNIRALDTKNLVEKNVVSLFESSLTRACNMVAGSLYEELIIVRTFYYGILEDIVNDGFIHNNEKYVLFSASAGQIRTKKSVFIKESVWKTVEKQITCDLSIDKINENGGINTNKYLAYLALASSATDTWQGFDIDKTVVVDDFSTTFETYVDYINRDTFEIEKNKYMPITIDHMDGCGIMLPKVSRKSFMCRLPFVKGLLVPMQFNSFVKINDGKSDIVDIYGKTWNIFNDDIQIIFTKSQFKMWKYYSSWDDYKKKFKDNNCHAGVCNVEEDFIKDARLNYQMLQTLSDLTDDELKYLATGINDDIEKISSDRATMLKILGVTEYNTNKNSIQQSLELYPEMLQDEHFKQTLRDLKKKLVNDGRHAKFPVNGKYTYLVPDLYAFCEWLFLGQENPKGILENGEVSCKLYQENIKLDVLRSPHLFLEHCIRKNNRKEMQKRWFISSGIYTSIHDPITRILQNDNDGDKGLVVSDEKLIEYAERNIDKWNVVPLYYEMTKAKDKPLSNKIMYEGMINAYSGGNIGEVSNNIAKCWNSENITQETIDVVKSLCMVNNFVIDYAKTLFTVTPPKEVKAKIKQYTGNKLPHFFKYAKDKTDEQVMSQNNSTVNKLNWIVKDKRFDFKSAQLGKFNYEFLMNNPNILPNSEIIKRYEQEKKKVMSYKFDDGYEGNHNYIWEKLRKHVSDGYDLKYVTDNIILHLFTKKSRTKDIFWNCFGDIVLENIKRNIDKPLDNGWIMCEECGDRVYSGMGKPKQYCNRCFKKVKLKKDRDNAKNRYISRKY